MDANGDLFGITNGILLNQGTVFEIKKTASGYASTPTTVVNFNSLEHPARRPDRQFQRQSVRRDPDGGANHGVRGHGQRLCSRGAGEAAAERRRPVSAQPLDHAGQFQQRGTTGPGGHGWNPRGDLIADSNGDLFGTTEAGGSGTAANPAEGTVFEIAKTPTGYDSTPTTLVTFNLDDPSGPGGPVAGLLADANGDLFGTSSFGGKRNSKVNEAQCSRSSRLRTGYAAAPTILVSFTGSPTALSQRAA